MSDRIGDVTEIDLALRRLVDRARRPGALSLWSVLDRGEREAATRWFLEVEDAGRGQVDKAVAAAMRFRPQTVRRWSLDKVVRSMGTVSLQESTVAQVILLHSACAPERLPMVRSFLDDLGIPHENGEVDSLTQLDASRHTLGKVAAGMVEEYGDRTVAIYFLTLWLAGTTLGEKSCEWLKERWRVRGPEDDGAEGAAARGDGPEGRDAGPGGTAGDGDRSADGRGPDAARAADPSGPDAAAAPAVPSGAHAATAPRPPSEAHAATAPADPPWGRGATAPSDPSEAHAATAPAGDAGGADTPREEARDPGPGEPAGRVWEPAPREGSLTTLDRIIDRALEDRARGTLGALNESEIDDAIDEFITLNGTRHESYFHPGYRDVLFEREMGESLRTEHPARLRWYWAGAVAAWAMRERWGRIASQYDDNPVVRELATGSSPASAAAVLPIVKALSRVGRSAEIGRALSDDALLRQPRLFPELLAAATGLLHDGDAAHARHILVVLDRTGGELEDRGVGPSRRDRLDARRRFAHSLRMLGEHEHARQLLEDLLEQDPDPNTHAMVHADLGLMQGRFDLLTDVALPARRTAAEKVRDRLAGGEEHYRQSVREAAEYSAHGHYCLGVLALARGTDDEKAERHLVAAHTQFSKRPQSYGRLLPRANLYAAVAKARQLQHDKLAHAARVIVDSLEAGARLPTHLVRETVDAFDLADDKESLRHVAEAITGTGDDLVLNELAECAAALRQSPLLAERLHERASAGDGPAEIRAAHLRAALRGHMHARSYERAGDALDELERQALDGVGAPEFQELLTEPERYDPAWTPEDATIARARCHEALGEFLEATNVLRDLFFSLMARETENSFDDAGGLLQRIYGYGRDRSQCSDMTDRYEAAARSFRELQADADTDPAPTRVVRVLVVGGAEPQARAEETARAEIRRRNPHIRPTFVYARWGSNWDRALADFEREFGRHDALVILRFMRTNLGRHVRRRWPGDRPWRFCWKGSPGAIAEAVAKAAAALRGG